jgi:HTH-type transcriptional regulator/antitoxin HipB
VAALDVPGLLRRIRRRADLSQRELAGRLGVSKSAVAAVEAGVRPLAVDLLARAAQLAGLRLALLDDRGQEVTGMSVAGVRDRGNRRYPAHLDVRHSDLGWWADLERYTRRRPDFTFDRKRRTRDADRERSGTPEDHLVLPDDSPEARRAFLAEQARRRRRARRLAWLAQHVGEPLEPPADAFVCECPPECEQLDDRSGKPVHAEGCPCGCDVA